MATTRIIPCHCRDCRIRRRIDAIALGILYGLAAVGVVAALWAAFVIVWAVAG